jgi:NADH:ubiquinone oxidoreductase subunit 3 (subunit A)
VETVGSYTTILIALVVGIFCLAAGLFISWLGRPMHPTPVKLEPYECGEPTVGPARVKFRTLFYIFAILFVIFDVEAIFLFPWAVVFMDLGLFAFLEMVVFIFVLLLGLAYAWRKGALRWR